MGTVFPAKMSTIGPQLPPHLRNKEEKDSDSDSSSSEEDSYGPKLPSTACRGPSPQKNRTEEPESDSDSDYGPSLPPGFRADKNKQESDSDDDDMVGPKMAEKSDGNNTEGIVKEMEARAQRMRDKLEGKDQQEVKRETWMLELPEEKANRFGLLPTARQFSRKGVEERGKDRSIWTDTPEEKQKKKEGVGAEEPEDDMTKIHRKRDREMAKVADELKVKRGASSLMDMHEEKLKKKKKEKGDEPKERRPFDRDTDLQANRFDEAAKKAMMKNAAKINDRFSSGNQKFL